MVKVLKIGGSILTDKNRRLFARSEEINRVAEEVAPYAENLVLIHGAGSFGHVQAEEYELREKFNPEGLRVTHSSVVELNRLVVEALARSGANPMPIHPFSCVTLRDGRIESFSLEPIERMIEEGLLPVLHGDVAMDITRRAGIVSGDDLVPYLARSLGAEIVAEGTDKDGVLVEGKPLERISSDDWPWFLAADVLGNPIPVFAPLAALLTVQVTVWGSVSRGLQRVFGVVVGVLVAFGFARLAGVHPWSIGLIIFVSLLAGRALRLGTQGSIQVPVSALLVLVLGATTGGYGYDRVVDTAIGAGVGIAANLVLVPRTHLNEAQAQVRGFAEELAGLLKGVADNLGAPVPGVQGEHLDAARHLSREAASAARAQ